METVINFFTLRPTFTVLRLKGRLVPLSVEYGGPDLHHGFRHLPGLGAARDSGGPVVAELPPPLARPGCTARFGPFDDRSRRHHHFRLADHPR